MLSCLFLLALVLSLSVPALAEEGQPEEKAPGVELTIDGEVSELVGEARGWTTYVPFDEAVQVFCPGVQVEAGEGCRTAAGEDFATLRLWTEKGYLEINGRYVYLPDGVETGEDGTVLVPIRPLARALGVEVAWTGKVELITGGEPLSAEGRPYDDETLDLMARVITHESGNQPFLGKLAVGSVVMNRVNSPIFPSTVYDVLFQKNQFPGATSMEPNEGSILAARLVLEGANVVPDAYWFNGVGKACWASRNKSLITVIGGHAFYG